MSNIDSNLIENALRGQLVETGNLSGKHSLDNAMENLAKEKHNKAIDDYQEKLEKIKDAEESFESKDMNGLEFLPNGTRIVVKQYAKNPYNKLKVQSGIIVGGASTLMDSLHFNNESGKVEEDDNGIVVGKVIEIGPECKYVRPGDDIFYLGHSTGVVPFPFFDQGFSIVSEQNVIVIINEKLKDRLTNK